MGIVFGDDTKCIEELVKLSLEHPNEAYLGKIDGKIRFVHIDTVWSDQQHFLSESVTEAIWLKRYYASMYFEEDKRKRLLCAILETVLICIECGGVSIHMDYVHKIFSKWNVVDALMTEMFNIFLKRYFKLSLET